MSVSAPLQPAQPSSIAIPPSDSQTGATDPNWKPAPGRLGNLTVPQEHTLNKFRTALSDDPNFPFSPERHDDATLLRYLRARKFDLDASITMIKNAEEWRKTFAVEELVKNFDFKEKAEVDKYYPQYYHRTDKEGRPIYIERLGGVNISEMYKITSQERLLQQLVYEYEKVERERFPACSKAVGHPVETSCTIMDLSGVGIKKFWDVKSYVSEASKISQDRYPERMGKFFIINAPWGFATVWNIVKGWLDPVTQAKIMILGSDYQKELFKVIDESSLPKDLGGTCVCTCPGGCSMSDAGPWNEPKVREALEQEGIHVS